MINTHFVRTLNAADRILSAIASGIAAGGADEDWDADEFRLAREVTEELGCVWDFKSWTHAAQTVRNHRALGGVELD